MFQSVVNASLLESIDPSIYCDTYSFCIWIPNPILPMLECPFGLLSGLRYSFFSQRFEIFLTNWQSKLAGRFVFVLLLFFECFRITTCWFGDQARYHSQKSQQRPLSKGHANKIRQQFPKRISRDQNTDQYFPITKD